MKKASVEERLIRSMGQAVEIAEGTTAPSREYVLPLTAKRIPVPVVPKRDAGPDGRGPLSGSEH